MESVQVISDQLEKPLNDGRTYCVVRLPNDLEALLVHDPITDEAGASMDVHVGSMSDELPGLAHALEHLLLRGTGKYPGEDDLGKYVSSHSGYSNAVTFPTHTNYHFKVAALPSDGQEPTPNDPSPLLGALDRLSRIAIDPLIHPETVNRELHAVDSEYKMHLRDDEWRLDQLEKSTSNPKHPWNHFDVGNLKVLKKDPESRGIKIRDVLLQFHEKHYSANRIKICVLGREPISLLATWVVQCFSDVQNKHLEPNRWPDELPYTRNELGVQHFVKPIANYRQLILTFPFLDETDLYETPPSQYIEFILCHKSDGSVLALLKDKGWATDMSANPVSICPGSPSIFCCKISLTHEGRKCYKEVAKIFFLYIALLKESGPQECIFEEAKRVAQLHFKYTEKFDVEDFTTSVTERMQGPVPRKWLLGPASHVKFAPELITKGIDCLRPDNLRVTVVAQEGTWDRMEEWYGTEYRAEPIPAEFLAELTTLAGTSSDKLPTELYLPRPNPFLPTDMELKQPRVLPPGKALLPELIRNDERARTWWMDNTFSVPKAHFVSLWRSPLLIGSPENLVKAWLLVRLVEDKLFCSACEAKEAGLSCEVSYEQRGLFIYVNGFNHKLPGLLELVITTIRDLEIRDDRFKIIKESAIDTFRNMAFQDPYVQAQSGMWVVTDKTFVDYETQAALVPHVEADAVRAFKQELLSRFHVESYAHGNIDRAEARKLSTIIESVLDPEVLPPGSWPVIRSLSLELGYTYRYHKELADPENVNNCIEYYIYGGDRADPVLRAKVRLLSQLIKETAYDWLRTKMQLGYVVSTFPEPTSTAYGFSVIVQGEKPCQYMEKCTTAFLRTYLKWLEKTSESEFEMQKQSLIAAILEKPKNLEESFNDYWRQIADEYYNFEIAQEYAMNIKTLTKNDMVEFYKRYIDPSSPHCSKLVVNINSQVKTTNGTNGHASATTNDAIATSFEDIQKHLRMKLRVDEAELEDAIDLWREVSLETKNVKEAKANGVDINDLGSFKQGLDTLSPPSIDLGRFERQG